MPYRRRGRIVEVYKNKKWRTLKIHPSIAAAVRHLTALNINVPEARKKRARKKR